MQDPGLSEASAQVRSVRWGVSHNPQGEGEFVVDGAARPWSELARSVREPVRWRPVPVPAAAGICWLIRTYDRSWMGNEMSDTAMTGFDWHRLPEDYGTLYEQLDAKYAHVYRASAVRLVGLANVRPGQAVIDIGAGTGISTEAVWAAMAGQGRVMAIDPSDQMLAQLRAKRSLSGALIRQGTAADVANLASEANFVGQTDAVISNFTYYYTYEAREYLHAAVRSILRPGGRWRFNLTRYLGELRIGGKLYNEFGATYLTHLSGVAAARGIEVSRTEADEDPAQFVDAGVEARSLSRAGFGEVAVEAWPLPLSPSEAYRFTIDGFYRYGSRTTFAPELMKVPVEIRVAILEEALDECRDEIDAGWVPYIANFSATR